jgi:hypothetical protein
MRSLPIILLALAACSSSAAESSSTADRDSATSALAADSTRAAAPGTRADPVYWWAGTGTPPDTMIVRGLYVNRFAAVSSRKMAKMIAIADSTEINALVIDIKDEFGLNYASTDPTVRRNAGTAGAIPNLRALLDTLRAHHILPIARIVVFKDSVAARVNPQHTIRKADGSAWRDKQGLAWVNPYDETIWEYNIRVAEEVVKLGFGEVQFDYIRFPEPYRSLPTQVFPNQKGRSKPDVLAEFLRTANGRLDKLGVRTTADIFGLVTTVRGALEIGQEWEKVAPVSDVLLPMTYPSHYPRGAFGIARPNADPYKVQLVAIKRARERSEALGISGQHVRPWIQAFSIGLPKYDASHVKDQMRGVYDAGVEGWVWWHPGSSYDLFVPALEKREERRAKR